MRREWSFLLVRSVYARTSWPSSEATAIRARTRRRICERCGPRLLFEIRRGFMKTKFKMRGRTPEAAASALGFPSVQALQNAI